jgi:hypothetical protein
MNEFIPLGQLPPISELFKMRSQHIKERFYNLRASDVTTDAQFDLTRTFIRDAILLQPIVFEQPVFSASAGSKFRDMVIREVRLPFTGSKEIFNYSPEDLSYPKNQEILLPVDGCLRVRLKSVLFSKREAVNAAGRLMGATIQMIAVNNEAVKDWSAKTDELITRKLLSFRKECLDLYNPKDLLSPAADG